VTQKNKGIITVKLTAFLAPPLALATFAGCVASDDLGETASASHLTKSVLAGTSYLTTVPGNYVSEGDQQVCYDIAARTGWDVTSEMKGVKIDPPADWADGGVAFTVTQPYLNWTADEGWKVLAVIVKGGPAYNLYNYQGFALAGNAHPDHDDFLHSPTTKRNIPAVSHYNVCYQELEPSGQGCTPGYWRNHCDRWSEVSASDLFDDVFGVISGLGDTFTLGQAIQEGGGGVHALARHATAALLNAYGGVANDDGTIVDYPMTPDAVIAAVQAALAEGGDVEATKNLFAGYNEAGCPLAGTRADKC
jgi:hypothetical protein